jgi:hypothetical protein
MDKKDFLQGIGLDRKKKQDKFQEAGSCWPTLELNVT